MADRRFGVFRPETAREILADHRARRGKPKSATHGGTAPLDGRTCRTQVVAVDGSGPKEPNDDGLYEGKVQVLNVADGYEAEESFAGGTPCWIAVLNDAGDNTSGSTSGDGGSLDGGEKHIGWRVGSVTSGDEEDPRPLFVIDPGGGTRRTSTNRRFKAALGGNLSSGDEFAQITGAVALDGGDTPSISSAVNSHKYAGLAGAFVTVEEDLTEPEGGDESGSDSGSDGGSRRYLLTTIEPVKVTLPTALQFVEGGSESGGATKTLQQKTRDFLLMPDGDESEWEDLVVFEQVTLTNDVEDDGTSITKDRQTGWVVDPGEPDTEVVIPIDPCGESSSG